MIDYHTKGAGVYKLTNTVNGKIYIGSTISFGERWYKHFEDVKNNGCRRLKSAIKKYGKDVFEAEVLEYVEATRERLCEREQHFLDTLLPFDNDGYNINKTASPSNFGTVHTDESKQRMSDAKKGEKNPMWGRTNKSETRVAFFKKMVGIKRTDDQRAKCGKHLAKPVCCYTTTGELHATFSSLSDAGRYLEKIQGVKFGNAVTGISSCVTKRPSCFTYKGFVWRYSSDPF